MEPTPIHGRAAAFNPVNRFTQIRVEWQPGEEDAPPPQTQFYEDDSQSIIVYNESPDIPYAAGINPYRGCEHGCIYCYARPYHEYLGLSAGLDFETKIFVKTRAPELLRREFMKRSWKPQTLGLSGVTDCYQPIERKLRITRGILEVCAEFRNPVQLITKNALILRDLDLLQELARYNCVSVAVSTTTLNEKLRPVMEPRTSIGLKRIEAIAKLNVAGVPTGVMVAPIIPGLTETEATEILKRAADAGAKFAGFTVVRLPHAVAPLFETWIREHFPMRAEKVLKRIKEARGGKLNDARFGKRMKGEGFTAEAISRLFKLARKNAGIPEHGPEVSAAHFKRPGATRQLFA
jgi:DNA repair photolyase